MGRTKIDYGIDLGTTNSAIARIENGEAVIKKTDTLKDTLPSCVYINKKKAFQSGDSAFNALKRDKLRAMKTWNASNDNSFIEFKRTMGSDKKYHSSNLEKDLSSEELSAEILKTLKSFVKDESLNSVVITIPAAFKNNQKEATRQAAILAGFNHIELLQEPVAASMAYGLNSDKKDGFWMVFDFGGGTFDAALLKVEDGIMQVIDTEGDNFLGGKNLDLAIVDQIIIPYLKENYEVNAILADEAKNMILRNAMKFFAEETKIQLSFNQSHNILSDIGDLGEDDEGEEFELDITVTDQQMTTCLSPVFQKAIDLTKKLLSRNNLEGSALDALILVGGPTFSPVLRKMLTEQICAPDTSADPMTVVAKGAALYASTINVSDEVREQTRDKTKIQLEIGNDSSTVETEIYVPIKILPDKTEGIIPSKVFAEVTRNDKSWASGKVTIGTSGELIEVQLIEGKTNALDITLYDEGGNILESEPNSFNIIQGSVIGSATLAYNIGLELKSKTTGKIAFRTIKGLEKNASLPATGTKNGAKTQKKIRPGIDEDFFTIALFEGEHDSEGTKGLHNNHINSIRIDGSMLPALLPENSDVDLTVKLDRSEKITVTAFFPYLDFTTDIQSEAEKDAISFSWLDKELKKAQGLVKELKDETETKGQYKLETFISELEEIEKILKKNQNDFDNQQEVLTKLRATVKAIDDYSYLSEWPKLEEKLKETFAGLELVNKEMQSDESKKALADYTIPYKEILENKDVKRGNILNDEMQSVYFELTLIYQLIGFIESYSNDFDSRKWIPNKRENARQLLNEGMKKIADTPNQRDLHELVVSVIHCLEPEDRPSDDSSVLVG